MIPDLVERLFAGFCHQLPERCLSYDGATLPVCARCLGVYASFAVVGSWHVLRAARRRRPWLPKVWCLPLAVAFLLCVADGLSGASHSWDLANGLRFVLGYGAGTAAACFLGQLLQRRFPESRGPSFHDRGPAWLLILLLLLPVPVLFLDAAWLAPLLLGFAVVGWLAYLLLLLLTLAEMFYRVCCWQRRWAAAPSTLE